MKAKNYLSLYQTYRKEFIDLWEVEPEIMGAINSKDILEMVMCHPDDKDTCYIKDFTHEYVSL